MRLIGSIFIIELAILFAILKITIASFILFIVGFSLLIIQLKSGYEDKE